MINFAQDALVVGDFLTRAAADYAARHASPATAATHPPVTRIDLDVWLGDGGPTPPSATLHFDTTAPDSWPGDGSHPGFAVIEFPHWLADFNARLEGEFDAVEVQGMDGVVRRVNSARFEQTFHGFFVDALRLARDAGVLEPLPKAPGCEMGVVNFECGYFWPDEDDRGLANMADPRENGTRRSKQPPATPQERVDADRNTYEVWADVAGPPTAAAISAVNAAMGIGLPAAKNLLASGAPIARDVPASEVRRIARHLRDRGVGVRTEPDFPHPIA